MKDEIRVAIVTGSIGVIGATLIHKRATHQIKVKLE
jgi:hypothetical protein